MNKVLALIGYKTKAMKLRESNGTFNGVSKELQDESQATTLVQTYGLLVGSRAWSSNVSNDSDYDYVVSKELYESIGTLVKFEDLGLDYSSCDNPLRTLKTVYFKGYIGTINLLVVESRELEDYKIMNDIIKCKINDDRAFKDLLETRGVRKLVMQSILQALEAKGKTKIVKYFDIL